MPGKLIVFILIILIMGTFIGFNINFTSDIKIWFGEKGVLKEVPILLSFFIVYIMGLLSSLPFIIVRKIKLAAKEKQREASAEEGEKDPAKKSYRVLGAKPAAQDEDSAD